MHGKIDILNPQSTAFHKMRHPKEMGSLDVDEFLTYLALERNVSPSTQKTALNALVFLYKQFLNIPLDDLKFSYSKTSTRIPIVLSHDEALTIIDNIDNKYKLMVNIMYGCGLRLMECCRLRIQDIDFSMHQIIVRESKGNKQRTTMLPDILFEPLKNQISITLLPVKPMILICPEAMEKFICLMPWQGNIKTLIPILNGNMYFLPRMYPKIQETERSEDIISMKAVSRKM